MGKILLGLDASTAMIGVCLWDMEKDQLIKLTYIDPSNDEGVLKCGEKFKEGLEALIKEYPGITDAVLEKAFVAMYGMQSSAHTTALLNQVNAIYQWICKEKGLNVNTITVSAARKLVFPNLRLQSKAKAKMSQKEQVFAYVLNELGDSYFPTKVMTKGKNKGEVRFEDYCGDMADAYVTAKSYAALLKLQKK